MTMHVQGKDDVDPAADPSARKKTVLAYTGLTCSIERAVHIRSSYVESTRSSAILK